MGRRLDNGGAVSASPPSFLSCGAQALSLISLLTFSVKGLSFYVCFLLYLLFLKQGGVEVVLQFEHK